MLTSIQNSLVKQIKKLHHAKGRREQQLFLLEGTHLLEGSIPILQEGKRTGSLFAIFTRE
ncbi:hypothetical protein Mic7113_5700 [Allocoleopsis franciscana PCC 7113]|uniref:MRM3-like substrate binding domain-containing protein n=1 Tax=Allocoleopsis franciscana PCC 7113 TaxID=1173027 RepID=K9WNE2_9CYAN|nr:hypothetical protein Mic7113_5700 [Allocoleopsis franciscana PCC 7113]